MMTNYNQSVKINHNPNWHYILGHPYRILTIGGLGLSKTIVLLKKSTTTYWQNLIDQK